MAKFTIKLKDGTTRGAGPLEETWIERLQKRTGCKTKTFQKIGGLLQEYKDVGCNHEA